jgi:hypothetical protein
MPEQFVNPSPNMSAGSLICFDFPCAGVGAGVEEPPQEAGTDKYCAFSADHLIYGNVNLKAPGIEELYGALGNPVKEQGHPFMREYSREGDPEFEQEDPTKGVHGPLFHDQVLDIDRGIQVNHTGRLSGGFAEFFASKPFFSSVVVSAVSVAPVRAGTQSIRLRKFVNWLEPQPEEPNRWYWRRAIQNNELMFTADVRIPDPTSIVQPDGSAASFEAEAVYKLVFQWKFWKYTGDPAYPSNPPDPEDDASNCNRLGISGFDEAMAFEVVQATHELGGSD